MRGELILIGMHRSGTSAVTRVLNLMGAYLGEPQELLFSEPKTFLPMNERGLWERLDVMLADEQLLMSVGCAWWNVGGFDAARVGAEARRAFNQSAGEILTRLRRRSPWLIKDPRLCVTLPLWRPLLRDPICVFVVRNPLEAARSLRTRDGFALEYGIALWERHLRDALAASDGLARVCVEYEAFVADPRAGSQRLLEELQKLGVLGLRMPATTAIDEFISTGLRHEQSTREEMSQQLNAAQLRLFDALLDGTAFASPKREPLSSAAQKTLSEFSRWAPTKPRY